MVAHRFALLAALILGSHAIVACAPATTDDSLTSKDKSADEADDEDEDDDSDESDTSKSTSSSKSTQKETPAEDTGSTTSAQTAPEEDPDTTTPDTTTPDTNTSSSSGGIGDVINSLPFNLSDIAGSFGGLGGLFDLFGGLFGGGSSSSSGGSNQGVLGSPDDSVGCCAGTKFFVCTSKVTMCSAQTLNSSSCKRDAQDDDICQ